MDDVNGLLHYGFRPSCDAAGLSHIPQAITGSSEQPSNWDAALSHGMSVLDQAFEETCRSCEDGQTHIVPLSGGLDSRTMLAGLLRHVPRDAVETVTIGMPGSYDFEIAPKVAKAARVNHSAFPLEDADWSVPALEETARQKGAFSQLFRSNVFRQAVYEKYPDSAVFWDGFMGDALAGAHLADDAFEDWEQACDWFSDWNAGVDPEFRSKDVALSMLPSEPFVPKSVLDFDEQLDYGIRQQCFIRPTPSDSQRVQPFLNGGWPSFMLQLPREWRSKRRFYRELVLAWEPELFSLPTQTNKGLPLDAPEWRRRVQHYGSRILYRTKKAVFPEVIDPNGMYWDWDAAFRDSSRLKEVGEGLIESLSDRDLSLEVDPVEVFRRHQQGEDFSSTLQVLGSYELYLRTSSQVTSPAPNPGSP